MSGLFDRLQSELDDREDEGGISPIDLLELPENLRRVMRFMLRAVVVSKDEIEKHIATWPEKDRMSGDDLGEGLRILVEQGWLIQLGEKDHPTYRVNLRRKKASALGDSIWGALDAKITERIEARQKDQGDDTKDA